VIVKEEYEYTHKYSSLSQTSSGDTKPNVVSG